MITCCMSRTSNSNAISLFMSQLFYHVILAFDCMITFGSCKQGSGGEGCEREDEL